MATAVDGLIDTLPAVERADAVPGPSQGEWTYADYAAIPDDGRRYEVVNGVLYMAPSPVERHQAASMQIGSQFFNHIQAAGLGRVYAAPFDVELSPGNVVQPDVIVVLNDNLQVITAERIIGAPNLVIEIASPSTATHDHDRKRRAYEQAGVREYWIADPYAWTVEILALENGEYRLLGVFQGQSILPSRVLPGLPFRVAQLFS